MRYLVCLDDPAPVEGQCTEMVWVEQAQVADYLPTVAQANAIGFAFFSSLFLIAAAVRSFKPQRMYS